MFSISPSITPLVLSFLVFYPWLLAIGVWQLGTRLTKGRPEIQVDVRTSQHGTSEAAPWTMVDPASLHEAQSAPLADEAGRFTFPASVALPSVPDRGAMLPDSPAGSPSAPRAPPAIS
ncbi:MAG: hypothetical protein MUF82_03660 [Bacteroidetes bacterium]|nr:hypothetical protein [Bacteroidota bacterium]